MSSSQQNVYLFDRAEESVMTRTMDGVINFWNRSAERLYGWTKEEAIGRISHDLLRTRFPKPLQEIESELVTHGRWKGKLVHTTRDGGRVVVESIWTLDSSGLPGAVVEINAPSFEPDAPPENQPESSKLTRGTQTGARITRISAADAMVQFAHIILVGGAFLCIFVASYFFYSYGWDSEERFGSPVGVVLHEVLPLIAAAFLIVALRLRREVKINLALVLFSLGFSACVAELALGLMLSFWGPAPTLVGGGDYSSQEEKQIVTLAKKYGVDFDTRNRFEVVMDLRRGGINAVPSIIPLLLLKNQHGSDLTSALSVNGKEVLPLGGISNRVTVLCNETGDYTIYDSDEHGFNNPQGIWTAGPIKIATVGDSFTQGACVSADDNFVSKIRKRHPATLNLGMAGEGPLLMLAALKEYLPLIKPKIVLWFFFEENDFTDLLKESKSPLLRRYLERDFQQGLFERQREVDQALTVYVEDAIRTEMAKRKRHLESSPDQAVNLTNFVKLVNLRRVLGVLNGGSAAAEKPEYSQVQLKLFGDILREAKAMVAGWGGNLYFVYLPARDRYSEAQHYNKSLVVSEVRAVDVPIVDLSETFSAERDPLSLFPFGRFGHYNELGNRLVANEVLRFIEPKNVP